MDDDDERFLGDNYKSPYMPECETLDEALAHLKKGMFYKHDRIGEVFQQKFNKMRCKIHRVLDHEEPLDELSYDVYVTSILVDCRALFLETKWRKTNSTLQNCYLSRGFKRFAEEIDSRFVNKEINGKKLGEIIKEWVDKRVAHVDYLEEDTEENYFDNILSILRRDTVENLFIDLLLIAEQYEHFKQRYGNTMTEQADNMLKNMTDIE